VTIQSVDDALSWIEREGLVLASARGALPNLVEAIVGEPVRGNSWWSHPRGREIYAISVGVSESPDILVCRLAGGKITFVHRRLWPALVKLAGRFEASRIAKVESVHTERGHHEKRETPFPKWVPADVMRSAKKVSVEEAETLLAKVS
jgi:hypothetical protein